jgi:hypothetical protein
MEEFCARQDEVVTKLREQIQELEEAKDPTDMDADDEDEGDEAEEPGTAARPRPRLGKVSRLPRRPVKAGPAELLLDGCGPRALWVDTAAGSPTPPAARAGRGPATGPAGLWWPIPPTEKPLLTTRRPSRVPILGRLPWLAGWRRLRRPRQKQASMAKHSAQPRDAGMGSCRGSGTGFLADGAEAVGTAPCSQCFQQNAPPPSPLPAPGPSLSPLRSSAAPFPGSPVLLTAPPAARGWLVWWHVGLGLSCSSCNAGLGTSIPLCGYGKVSCRLGTAARAMLACSPPLGGFELPRRLLHGFVYVALVGLRAFPPFQA